MYRLQCFGGAVVKAPDGGEIHFRSRKHLALLLYLAVHPRRALGRDELAGLLWDSEEPLARHSLSQALYDIRRRLDSVQLQARRGMLSLPEGAIEYEGAELEEAVRSGELSRVPELYRGDFAPNLERLSDRFDRWLESERTRFRTVAQMALRRYAEECDLQGRWGEMCLTGLRLVRLDPLDEAAHRALMRALWLHGDQQSALRHYAQVEEFLVRELPDGISQQTRELVQRIRSSRPPARNRTEADSADPPLVGREAEFERLRVAMESLRQGQGGLAIVRGEAGIGKTRLLQELIRLAPVEGIVRLCSRCYSAERDVAYGPVIDGIKSLAERSAQSAEGDGNRYYQLGHLFPELFESAAEQEYHGVDPAVRRRRLYEEVADLLRRGCAEGPILWIIEDIQWIDSSSASLLHYVARRLRESPLLLIASLRTNDEVEDAARRLVEGDGTPVRPTFVDLSPLSTSAVRELIRHAGTPSGNERASQLAEKYSGGNPFYALEILRAAESMEETEEPGLPTSCLSERLKHFLATRLRGISHAGLRTLDAIAILERNAAAENVATLVGTGVGRVIEAVQELERRGLVVQEATRLTFRHDLLREFIYQNQGSLRKTALHLASAELLARSGDVGPATLAIHFSRGGDQARTYEFALRAVEQAAEACAHSEAERLAAIAVEAATSAENKFNARLTLAQASRGAGNFHQAVITLQALLKEPRLLPSRKLTLLLLLAQTKLDLGLFREALDAALLATTVLDSELDASDNELRFTVLSIQLKSAVLANEHLLATKIFERIDDLQKTILPATLKPSTLANIVIAKVPYATYYKSSNLALSFFADLEHLIPDLPYSLAHKLRLSKAAVQFRLGQLAHARETLNEALKATDHAKDIYGTANLRNNLACVHLEEGDWAQARAECHQALSIYETLSIHAHSGLTARINLGHTAFYEGQLIQARQFYEAVLVKAEERRIQHWRIQLNAWLGLIALQLGNLEKAEQHWSQIRSFGTSDLAGMEDRFPYEWLACFMNVRNDVLAPTAAVNGLRERAKQEHETDRLSYTKLMLLAELYAQVWTLPNGGAILDSGRDRENLRWFERVVTRWFRSVMRGPKV